MYPARARIQAACIFVVLKVDFLVRGVLDLQVILPSERRR